MTAADGILVVDKPADWTSHDVVARGRQLAATRKVGHAGTLDPMATGVLVLGIGRATRLLGYLSLTTKGYDATIRLGQSTLTDDAQGEVLASVDAEHIDAAVITARVAKLTGDLMQVPSAVSAIKINGERAYKRVREGQTVELAARPVSVTEFTVSDVRRSAGVVDVDVHVECSSGTYIRALARDLGADLGVGGHLTTLRRTRVGRYDLGQAHTLDELAALGSDDLPVEPLDRVAQRSFAWYVVSEDLVPAVRNGRAIHVRLQVDGDPAPGVDAGVGHVETSSPSFEAGRRSDGPGPVAVLAPGGEFIGLYEQHGPVAKAVAVFAPA
jgi:tRNA pseudouridine55 synthase